MTHNPDPRATMVRHARDFHRRGWMLGTSGNLSVRTAPGADDYWITASGRSKGELTPVDFLRVAIDGTVRERFAPADKPSAESSLHQVIYRRHPGAGAVYHVHSVDNNLASRLADERGLLRLPTVEMIKGFGIWEFEPAVDIAVLTNHADVPRIAADLEALLDATPPAIPAFIIRDHGITTWAPTPTAARNQVELLEFLLGFLVQARQLGV